MPDLAGRCWQTQRGTRPEKKMTPPEFLHSGLPAIHNLTQEKTYRTFTQVPLRTDKLARDATTESACHPPFCFLDGPDFLSSAGRRDRSFSAISHANWRRSFWVRMGNGPCCPVHRARPRLQQSV